MFPNSQQGGNLYAPFQEKKIAENLFEATYIKN